MELYIVESRKDYLEVIDLEYPRFKFVLDEISFKVNNGELVVDVGKLSVLRSFVKKEGDDDFPEDMEDEFLEEHAQKIIKELFDPLLDSTLP